MLKLTSYYLIFLQALKLSLIPYTGVQNWLIDGFKYPFYSYFPTYPGWNGAWLTNPYSFFWQLWYLPSALMGWYSFMVYMWCFDSVLLIVVSKFQSPIYTLAFAVSSWLLFILNPADILILWLAVIGKEAKIMSVFAVAVKLPTLAPAYVWNFIIYKSILSQTNIIANPGGIPRYIFLGLWIIHPYLINFYNYLVIRNKLIKVKYQDSKLITNFCPYCGDQSSTFQTRRQFKDHVEKDCILK